MTSLRKRQQGFTIVELLIVIVVIGILAALVITTFNGIQERGRDTERQTDIKALHGQIEAYFAQNGKYPTLADMQNTASGGFVETELRGLDKGALEDPTGNTDQLASAPAEKVYSYEVNDGSGGACDNTTTDCTSYTLTATLEGTIDGAGTYVKTSLNN